MSRRSETRPKRFALVKFLIDGKLCVLESKKLKIILPRAGQCDVDVQFGKSVLKVDIVSVNGKLIHIVLYHFLLINNVLFLNSGFSTNLILPPYL